MELERLESEILKLANLILNLIELIEQPDKEIEDLEVTLRKDFKEMDKDGLSTLKLKCEMVKCELNAIWQSSKHKHVKNFKHLTTYDEFFNESSLRLNHSRNLNEAYDYISEYIQLPAFEDVLGIIKDNIKRN